MKAFITKYALTQGILEVEGELDTKGEYLHWKEDGSWLRQFTHRRHFCATLMEALAVAETMRVKKVSSLEKACARLRSLEIKVSAL